MPENDLLKYKISLIGDGGVGKTSLVKQFVHNQFDDKYVKTLGTNIYSKELTIDTGPGTEKNVVMQIWDIMGQRVFKSIIRSALENTNGVILVCDLTKLDTLINLLHWIKIIYKNTSDFSLVFLGNKSDMDDLQFGLPAIYGLCACFGSRAYLTSAKTGNNVENAFQALVDDIYAKKCAPPKEKFSFNLEKLKIPQVIRLEDRIFITFCEAVGDMDTGMPIIERVYKELELDFTNLTFEELEVAVTGLKYYLDEYQPDLGPEFETKAKKILAETGTR